MSLGKVSEGLILEEHGKLTPHGAHFMKVIHIEMLQLIQNKIREEGKKM